jgi:F0F1-type ATP synthase assembly protein I
MARATFVKPAHILCAYISFVAGSLQVLVFTDKWGLGIVILITIILLIAGIAHVRNKPKVIQRKSSAKRRSATKSKSIGR